MLVLVVMCVFAFGVVEVVVPLCGECIVAVTHLDSSWLFWLVPKRHGKMHRIRPFLPNNNDNPKKPHTIAIQPSLVGGNGNSSAILVIWDNCT